MTLGSAKQRKRARASSAAGNESQVSNWQERKICTWLTMVRMDAWGTRRPGVRVMVALRGRQTSAYAPTRVEPMRLTVCVIPSLPKHDYQCQRMPVLERAAL